MAKRIETKTSRTAEMTCLSRAASFYESNPCYKSHDYVAPLLVPSLMKVLIRLPFLRKLFYNAIAPSGIYEYVIARTKYIDEVFQQAIDKGFNQILIFGAGFDTRAIRFQSGLKNMKVFELDVPVTQRAKIQQYGNRNILVPSNIVFISIDFDRESLRQKLDDSGFERNKRSLFILEGLLMYLEPHSITQTFTVIKEYAGKGSMIVFDTVHSSVLQHENLYYGEAGALQMVAKANEQWTFGMEKSDVEPFLANYGFRLLDCKDARDLENTYFKGTDGNIVGRINGTHFIVTAEK